MKYLIEIPEEIEQALEQRASATGDDVAHLIQMAVVSFVRSDAKADRRPDCPLESVEIVPPFDLPRNASRAMSIQSQSHRRPDPIAGSA